MVRTRARHVFPTPFDCCVKPICRCVTRLVVIAFKTLESRGLRAPLYVKLLVAPQSREANYRDAMAALIAMLDDRLRSGSKSVEDDVRRQQIGSGMRGDKRRTYRFQDDMVVDHVTGKSMQVSKAMKGHMAALWM